MFLIPFKYSSFHANIFQWFGFVQRLGGCGIPILCIPNSLPVVNWMVATQKLHLEEATDFILTCLRWFGFGAIVQLFQARASLSSEDWLADVFHPVYSEIHSIGGNLWRLPPKNHVLVQFSCASSCKQLETGLKSEGGDIVGIYWHRFSFSSS